MADGRTARIATEQRLQRRLRRDHAAPRPAQAGVPGTRCAPWTLKRSACAARCSRRVVVDRPARPCPARAGIFSTSMRRITGSSRRSIRALRWYSASSSGAPDALDEAHLLHQLPWMLVIVAVEGGEFPVDSSVSISRRSGVRSSSVVGRCRCVARERRSHLARSRAAEITTSAARGRAPGDDPLDGRGTRGSRQRQEWKNDGTGGFTAEPRYFTVRGGQAQIPPVRGTNALGRDPDRPARDRQTCYPSPVDARSGSAGRRRPPHGRDARDARLPVRAGASVAAFADAPQSVLADAFPPRRLRAAATSLAAPPWPLVRPGLGSRVRVPVRDPRAGAHLTLFAWIVSTRRSRRLFVARLLGSGARSSSSLARRRAPRSRSASSSSRTRRAFTATRALTNAMSTTFSTAACASLVLSAEPSRDVQGSPRFALFAFADLAS